MVVSPLGGWLHCQLYKSRSRLSASRVVAFIAGRSAPPDKKMGHAGAIVSAGRESYASKRAALEDAGVQVADIPAQIPQLLSATAAISHVA
jgi:succinyl-CoA synthetase alpha subunit